MRVKILNLDTIGGREKEWNLMNGTICERKSRKGDGDSWVGKNCFWNLIITENKKKVANGEQWVIRGMNQVLRVVRNRDFESNLKHRILELNYKKEKKIRIWLMENDAEDDLNFSLSLSISLNVVRK